ncbi:roadblock/LC7 domain-containing protein [Skeletonema marinoi]|uniref:Dynein light chain roadblock n=1 Tax=Skeletonema marinoi TaxID=267567 RepID=A0AAD9DGI2_9STRA|nr:roadblock/LC7 domain-containing protein [Skeletonema marinoi]
MSNQETTANFTTAEMEETIARISSHKGVEGVMIMNREACRCHHSIDLDEDKAKTHSAALSELTAKASHIVGLLNRDDELTFLRIRSKQREIMVSPDKGFILVVLQNPNVSEE